MDAEGLVLARVDDEMNELERDNAPGAPGWRERLGVPLTVFGGEPFLPYRYALAPLLADAQGRQPVVLVDTGLEPSALPVASDVDRFFDTCSPRMSAS